ncbi:hypothetical protein [Microvirga mediterraneensis]|uniref:Uncharacterized protein n=1 Tax=Microvirga mediterraneensis TaxID=2754695 RepID=A0A838BPC9_9HYPH|nr:hypothetical protein [Microvirga mediterraneensis]MBA1157298.1 hypothetical protein [Microvirga mediterraneensis]
MASIRGSIFRKVAGLLAFLIIIWFQEFGEILWSLIIGELKSIENEFPFFAADALLFIIISFLIYVLAFGVGIWGAFGLSRPRQNMQSNSRPSFRLLMLFAASSIPNIFLLLLVAKELEFTGRKTFHLSVPIIITPIILGSIWFQLQRGDRESSDSEATGGA